MFKDETIIITGASGGIGSAIAQALSTTGATLVLVGLEQTTLEQLNQDLGGQHYFLVANIATVEGRENILQFCQQLNNGVDILINGAGIGQFTLLKDMESDRISALININLTSTIHLTQLLLPVLLSRPNARVVNIGSILGSIGFPGSTVYCASKFGIRGFSEALNRELMDTSVHVSYFAPRATKTTINDQRLVAMNEELGTRMDDPKEAAALFVKFLKADSRRAYLGWPEKLFVRINSVLPGIVDKSIFKQLPIIKRFCK